MPAEPPHGVHAGDLVRDLEGDPDEKLIAVAAHKTPADDHLIEEIGQTVAGCNPGYPRDDLVVDAVYLGDLETTGGYWRHADDVRRAVAFGAVRPYSFPASRLELVEEVEEVTT
jgi:hypothetical protein